MRTSLVIRGSVASLALFAAAAWGSPAAAQAGEAEPDEEEAAESSEAESEPSPPSAEDEETAQAHFRIGRSYYDTGRFADSAREFQRAYDLSRRPMLLYNVFLAHRDAGNIPEATATLRLYLELVPEAPEREQLIARLATLERLASQGGAADATEGSEPDEPDGPTPAPGGGGGMWTPGWVIAGAGAAVVVASIITGAMALGARGQLTDMCDASGGCPPGFEAKRDEAVTLAGVTDALLFGGLAIAVTGVVLAVVVSDGGGTETTAACGPGGCSLRVRF